MRVQPALPASVLLLSLLLSQSAHTHEGLEQRQVLVSAETGRLEILVAWELPDGALAAELRAAIDQDGSGLVDQPTEELARAQLLLPRLTAGWRLEVAGEPVVLEPVEVELRDRDGAGARRGFEGAALCVVSGDWVGETPIRLVIEPGAVPLRAELQVLPPLTIAHSTVPPAPDAPVIGPVEVRPDVPFEAIVHWPTGGPADRAARPR